MAATSGRAARTVRATSPARSDRSAAAVRLARPRTVEEDGRRKAYRPLPAAERARALAAGIEAYERGDWFLAHEILEPAWMGTDDPLERSLHQGLIKLAAAYVHAARGNPAGTAKNLAGAQARLAAVVARSGPTAGLDLADLLEQIGTRLASFEGADGGRPEQPLPAPRLRWIGRADE